MTERLKVEVNGKWYAVEVGDLNVDPVRAVVDGHVIEVSLSSVQPEQAETQASPSAPAMPPSASPAPAQTASSPAPSQLPQPAAADRSPSAVKMFIAPMPGSILSILVSVGDQVVTGDTVCILEAMKMEQSLRADWSGVVKAIYVVVGEQVLGGAPILELE
ncbi:MAG: acetyl-CoA carboxylase biotin carboxyl carrier protein subunit [Chloroflexi bacterium]|nr:acetyl-CoA carboxylase biotin carboxyl carrier protein subunit [Chloroflexota bacterium]